MLPTIGLRELRLRPAQAIEAYLPVLWRYQNADAVQVPIFLKAGLAWNHLTRLVMGIVLA